MEQVDLAGLRVSAQGLGCMGMSQAYGTPDDDESIATLHRALELGVTFWDTANVYGDGENERLLSRVLRDRRDEVTLATKFGILRTGPGAYGAPATSGAPDYVRQSCEESLQRLGVEQIDLYYLHRPPQDVPIEDTIGAMAGLVEQGKVRFLGVSEVDSDQLRRAHGVHPITAVQSEYSLWTRDVEAVAPTMAELGVGLVPFSPLGRGFLTGTFDRSDIPEGDMRQRLPRFAADTEAANARVVDGVRAVAEAHDATAAQVALAWVQAQSERLGVPVVAIPGTKRRKWLEQNVAALDLTLTGDELASLDGLAELVSGTRY